MHQNKTKTCDFLNGNVVFQMFQRMFEYLHPLLVLTPDARAHLVVQTKLSVNHVDQFKAAPVSPPLSLPLHPQMSCKNYCYFSSHYFTCYHYFI